jgi:hypothetical protein
MTPKQAKILGTGEKQADFVETLHLLDKVGIGSSWMTDNKREEMRQHVLDEQEQMVAKKLAEACSLCGKTAQELGLVRLLRCSACTIAPLYCSAECQRGAWERHKSECKASRMAGKKCASV